MSLIVEKTEDDIKAAESIRNSPLMKAIEDHNIEKVKQALNNGTSTLASADPTNDALYECIITAQYDMASIILTHLSKFHEVILENTPLDRDTTTIILEYFGNVHDQIRNGWSKMCQLGWMNSMSDLRLLQLLILHGPRNVINRKSPDFGEHCLVSAIKNNAQNIIKILLCIYYDELGTDLLNTIQSDLRQTLKHKIDKIKKIKQKKEIIAIFEMYENNLEQLQSKVLGMILSDQFGKYKVLKGYVKQRQDLFPILKDYKFQQLVKQMTKESKEKLKKYKAALKAEEEASKIAQKLPKSFEISPNKSLYDSAVESCVVQ